MNRMSRATTRSPPAHRTSIELGSTSAIGARSEARRMQGPVDKHAGASWCHNGLGVFSRISGFAGLSGYRCRLPKERPAEQFWR